METTLSGGSVEITSTSPSKPLWFDKSKGQLTKNFNISEFNVSRSRPDLLPEKIPDAYHDNLLALAQSLQYMRTMIYNNKTITVLSGWRSRKLNSAVGGSISSQHLVGEAADIQVAKSPAFDAFSFLVNFTWSRSGTFLSEQLGQVIYYHDQNFMHVALKGSRFKKFTPCIHAPKYGYKYHVLSSMSGYTTIMSELNYSRKYKVPRNYQK